MALITLAARAAHQLARRATDPLGIIWKDFYTDSTTTIKVFLWVVSLILGLMILTAGAAVIGFLLLCVGTLLCCIFREIYKVVMFVVHPILSGIRDFQAASEESRGRRREPEEARGQRDAIGRSLRGGGVINVNVQIAQKEDDVEMGYLGMRNQGPLPLRMGQMPPAYIYRTQ